MIVVKATIHASLNGQTRVPRDFYTHMLHYMYIWPVLYMYLCVCVFGCVCVCVRVSVHGDP